MIQKKILALLLALAVVLALVGCGGGGMSAEEIVEAAIEAEDNIETYQADMNMTLTMTAPGEEPYEQSNLATITLDNVNREMKMDISTTLNLPPEEGGFTDMEIEQYIVDGVVYSEMPMPGLGTVWVKQEMPQGYWEETSGLEQNIEMLELAQVELSGSEVVNGIDCYVIEVVPDIGTIREMMMQQSGVGELGGEEMADLSVKQWVAKDTFFPMKVEIQMTIAINWGDLMGLPLEGEEQFEMTMDMGSIIIYRNYNQPVSIELPAEAEEAIETTFLD